MDFMHRSEIPGIVVQFHGAPLKKVKVKMKKDGTAAMEKT